MEKVPARVWLADCPTRLTVEIIADKWAVLVLFGLSQRSRRHGELVELIGGISRKVLTQTVRRLQRYGLVEQDVVGPRHTEYRLTQLGQTLIGPIQSLTEWARDHSADVLSFQESMQTVDRA